MSNYNSPIIFLHIEKAGGSTLHNILANFYSNDTVLHLNYMSDGKAEIESVNQDQIQLIKGHIGYGVHKYIKKDFKYYTMMRNPVERVVSYYFYVKQKSIHPHFNLIKSSNWSIVDYIKKAENVQMDNGQIRYITGTNKAFGTINEKDLEQAKLLIEEHFISVGLTERFDESLILLKNKIGWKKYPVYERANVNRNKEKNIDQESLKVIEEYNKFDLQLYDFVVKRFNQELFKENIANDLKKFNKEVSKYYLKKRIKGMLTGGKK